MLLTGGSSQLKFSMPRLTGSKSKWYDMMDSDSSGICDAHNRSLQQMTGSAPPSMVADCLTQLDQKDDYDRQVYAIKSTAATVFVGQSSLFGIRF